jgi:polysaccharide export outer membrane protein
VQQDGLARIPKIGEIQLDGLTLDQAERILERRFSEFYPGAFVRTRYTNKRIFVFKGNTGLVLPLRNEKISLIDVLAQTGGVADNMRASNIRLVRGDLRDPTIKVINLRTYAGLTEHDLTIEANDIIYVEPVRKSFLEALRDISPILGFLSTTLTLILLIRRN